MAGELKGPEPGGAVTLASFWVLGGTLKMMLWSLYRSTDFEVHRNWLAITSSRPLGEWYFEDTSQWTLDYPPFFAYFEWLLSKFAPLFDPGMLTISAEPYATAPTILFQRLTVVATDTVLFLGAAWYWQSSRGNNGKGKSKSTSRGSSTLRDHRTLVLLMLLTFLNPGLLLVDHIHFQYNGFLLGILVVSICQIRKGNDLMAGILFAALLNFKHIFLYVAPLYFVYLFRRYCCHIGPDGGRIGPGRVPTRLLLFGTLDLGNLAVLGVCVLATFAIAFVPFFAAGGAEGILQIFRRMFPFEGRGLCHAYWAPNVWALYNILDKVLEIALNRWYAGTYSTPKSNITKGLVESIRHAVLPAVKPGHTALLTLIAMGPILWCTWRRPDPKQFAKYAGLCTAMSFLFGWHVHEKAILTVTLPLGLALLEVDGLLMTARDKKEEFKEGGSSRICWETEAFLLLYITANASLLPLIFTTFELPVKVCLLVGHYCCVAASIETGPWDSILVLLRRFYSLGFLFVQIFQSIVQPMIFSDYPFLPLLLWSAYSSIGVIVSISMYLYGLLER